MTKKLLSTPYVNDLVLHQNACEEKKLKDTIDQIERLKSIYSRQKDQEKMFFAVQQMTVPVRTDPIVRNLRKGLDLDGKEEEIQERSPGSMSIQDLLASPPGISTRREKRGLVLGPDSEVTVKNNDSSTRESTPFEVAENHPVKVKFQTPVVNYTSKVQMSRRMVSPMPRQRKKSTRDVLPNYNKSGSMPESCPLNNSVSKLNVDTATNRSQKNPKWLSRNRGDSFYGSTTDKYNVPKLRDLPPLHINVYETPCSAKDSREKWQTIVNGIRNSSIRETRSAAELNKYNRESRSRWQTVCKERQGERPNSVMKKEDVVLKDGEQLTLVKFLPKSRQANYIKEAQRFQHGF